MSACISAFFSGSVSNDRQHASIRRRWIPVRSFLRPGSQWLDGLAGHSRLHQSKPRPTPSSRTLPFSFQPALSTPGIHSFLRKETLRGRARRARACGSWRFEAPRRVDVIRSDPISSPLSDRGIFGDLVGWRPVSFPVHSAGSWWETSWKLQVAPWARCRWNTAKRWATFKE